MIQILLVILAIGTALFFLGRKFWKEFYGNKDGCDGCG